MPVTADDFLWEATGFSGSGTSVVVTHPDAGGTTAGTTVVVMLYTAATTVTMPAGFASVGAVVLGYAYVKSDVAAAETSWTFTLNVSTTAAWYMVELDNVSLADPYDGNATSTGTIANGATRTTGTVSLNAGSSGVALAMFGAAKLAADVQSWSGYTNSFVERVDAGPGGGVAGRTIAVAYKLYDTFGSFESTATFATSGASASTTGLMLLLRSADASINAPVAFHTGFEFGTHGGMGNTSTGPLNGAIAPFGTFGTNYLVQAGSARNGGYGLRVTTTAVDAYVGLPQLTAAAVAIGFNVRPVSGSGTWTPMVLAISGGSGDDLALTYDVATEKLGLLWGGGSTVWQTGTTPLGTWTWVDVAASFNSSVWHAEWSVETGDGSQASPTDLTGRTPATQVLPELGLVTGSVTAAVDFDDVVLSRYYAAHPLGPHVVRLLTPETTGATVSGTSTNFSRFTANGTLAAITADTAGALLDEVPPTVSASSDGVVQTAVAASDYLNLPMTTYALTSSEIIAGVRFVASEWGGTGSGTGTLGWRGYDGTTETTFQAAGTLYDADSLTAISATYPRWVSAMWSGGASGAWTQTRLNAAAIRMGFSTDATPDMGASAVYLEVATRATPVYRQITTGEADEFTVDLRVDPYNSASVSYLIESTDATRGATFFYSISGTPQTPVYVNPSDTEEVVVNAASFGEISDVSLEPDPVV